MLAWAYLRPLLLSQTMSSKQHAALPDSLALMQVPEIGSILGHIQDMPQHEILRKLSKMKSLRNVMSYMVSSFLSARAPSVTSFSGVCDCCVHSTMTAHSLSIHSKSF